MLLTLTIAPLRPCAIAVAAKARAQCSGPATLTLRNRRRLGVGVEQRHKREIGGVVDQDVSLAEALDGRGHDPRAVGGDADVGRDDQNVAPHVLDQRRGASERVPVRPAIATLRPHAQRRGRRRSRSPPRRRLGSRSFRRRRCVPSWDGSERGSSADRELAIVGRDSRPSPTRTEFCQKAASDVPEWARRLTIPSPLVGREGRGVAHAHVAWSSMRGSVECVAPSTSITSLATSAAKSTINPASTTCRRNRKPIECLRRRPCQRRRSAAVAS